MEGVQTDFLDIEANSLSDCVKKMKISGKQACDLKKHKECKWTDEHGGRFTLTLELIN